MSRVARIHLELPPELLAGFDDMARLRGETRSVVLREALREKLEREARRAVWATGERS